MGITAGTAEQDLAGTVRVAAAGDEEAFGRIVAAYQVPVYSVCMAVCRDRSLAEEAAESTWVRVWQALGSLRQPQRLRPWVVSIAMNEARQQSRRRRRRSQVETGMERSDEGAGSDRPVPGGVDPATGIGSLDLRRALRRLDPSTRALLTMRYVLGFDSGELAEIVGISPAGVRQRLRRSLTRLRQELE